MKKISIIGSRGIPARYGGFETFAEHLAMMLSEAGCEVMIGNEAGSDDSIGGTDKIRIFKSKYRKSKNPLAYYYDSLRAAVKFSEIVLVCGVGGAIFYRLFKRPGIKIITNVDGLEHQRGKYSFIKKIYVRLSQSLADRYSDAIIADSEQVSVFWKKKFSTPDKKLKVISYGADPALPVRKSDLDERDLSQGSFFLVIARLVPENHILEIIEAFQNSGSSRKLVIVGGLDDSLYVQKLKSREDSRILFTGSVYSKQILDSLRGSCIAYIHGHSVGGTNPSLIEAMAASCVCICHDNVYNHETSSSKQLYFRSAEDLSRMIRKLESMAAGERQSYREAAFNRVQSAYQWSEVGLQYAALFEELNERRDSI